MSLTSRPSFRLLPLSVALTVCICSLGLTGCSQNSNSIIGKITYNGQPVTRGQVSVLTAKGVQASGTIFPDGTYLVKGVPAELCYIAVVSEEEAPQPQAITPQNVGEMKKKMGDELAQRQAGNSDTQRSDRPKTLVPGRYSDPMKSGLQVTVSQSRQTYDISLDGELDAPAPGQ